MGITGYCMRDDAIASINNFRTKEADVTSEIIGRVTSLG